jgi:hypothetical protein
MGCKPLFFREVVVGCGDGCWGGAVNGGKQSLER